MKDSVNEMEDDILEIKHSKLDKVKLGKHYLVFYFQLWSGKGRPVWFMAACYYLASLLARWLVSVMATQHIISTIALYGFVVISLGQDKVTENRFVLKIQLNFTLKEAFPELLLDETDMNLSQFSQPKDTVMKIYCGIWWWQWFIQLCPGWPFLFEEIYGTM